MEKPRVLVINTVNMGFTGITSVIMNYVRKTYEAVQYDFVLCGQVESSFADELTGYDCRVWIPPCSRVKNPFTYTSWLKKLIKVNGYDVIHVHGNSGTMFFEIHAAKRAGVSVRIAHCHSSSCKYMLAHRVLKPFLNKELTYALACSDVAGKWLFTGNYSVLTNGIEVEKFAFAQETRHLYREQLKLGDSFVVGHVAHMSTGKNHMFLLRVFEKLIKVCPQSKLLLIGDGELHRKIELFAKEHGLSEYIHLLGRRSDVAQLYQCMDVFVLPSLFEGLPVTLVEAQASGLSCIASDRVTTEVNITHNISYLGIEDNDEQAWVNELEKHTVKNMDRCECSDILKRSKFNIVNCSNELLELYRSAR